MFRNMRYQDGLLAAASVIIGWALEARSVAEQGFLGYAVALAVCGLVGGYVTRSRLIAPTALWVGQVGALMMQRPPMWGVSLGVVTAAISIAVLAAILGVVARRAATRNT